MGTDVIELEYQALISPPLKVHHSVCTELTDLVNRISRIIPAIEATRPGSTGREVLVSLVNSVVKTKSFLQRNSESSKLYLALVSKKFLERCDGHKKKLENILCKIQDWVPDLLAVQISQLVADHRNVHLCLDSSDIEVGKVLREILRQDASASDSQELEALQFAASRLHITTKKALLTEKRSIKKLLYKVGESDPKKELLESLLALLNKHRELILGGERDNSSDHNEMNFPSQHFTSDSLDRRAVNSSMEHASPQSFDNSSWSIASPGSSIHSNMSLFSLDNSDVSNFMDTRRINGLSQTSVNNEDCDCSNHSLSELLERGAEFLSGLSRFSWEFQCRIIEDLKSNLKNNDQSFSSLSSDNFIEPLLQHMRDAREILDLKAQRAGFQLLLELLSKCIIEIPHVYEDAFNLVLSFLNSEMSEEALSSLELLSHHQYHRFRINVSDFIADIVKFLNSQNRDLQEKAIRVLYILSDRNDVPLLIVSECILKLVSFLEDSTLAGNSIMTLRNLCGSKEGRLCFAEIVKLLDVGSHEIQEHGLTLLLSLCSQNDQYCRLAIDAGIFPTLFYISVHGNERGKIYAVELMRLLRD